MSAAPSPELEPSLGGGGGSDDDGESGGGFGVRRKQTEETLLDAGQVAETAAAGVAGANATLPHLDTIQAAFGRHDVGHVRAAVGGDAGGAARAIGAEAYATGDRVAFDGAPDVHTAAHEAAHVVAQHAGIQPLGGVGTAGDQFERDADEVADAVASGRSAEAILDRQLGAASATASSSRAVQRKPTPAADAANSTQAAVLVIDPPSIRFGRIPYVSGKGRQEADPIAVTAFNPTARTITLDDIRADAGRDFPIYSDGDGHDDPSRRDRCAFASASGRIIRAPRPRRST